MVEKLIPELKSRGYRVATIKHTQDDVSLDEPGKDSWRHIQAGSEATVIRTSNEVTLIKPMTEAKLEDIAPLLGEECDVILAEGFKQDSAPKIEVHRREKGPPLENVKQLAAIATDEPLDTKTRQFSLDDITGLIDFMEMGFIRPNEERLSLYVNGKVISMSAFPRDFIAAVSMAMASCLHGVDKVNTLKLFFNRGKAGRGK